MSYRIETEEAVEEAVRRIALEQVGQAISLLRSMADENAEQSVHECRKRVKKLRGLIRLVRPSLGKSYRPANVVFRNASRRLSPFRDAHALAATFDDVVAADPQRLPAGGLGPVWRELARRADQSTRSLSGDSPPVQRALELLNEGADAVDGWALDDSGWDAVSGGLARTYRQGLTALGEVDEQPTPDRFHELRKRAKYTWYHLQLIDSAPPMLDSTAARFHRMSDALGDAHDLAVMRDVFLEDPEAFGGSDMVDAALVLVDGYRSLLERRGMALAAWLYAERPDAWVERFGAYWGLRPQKSDRKAGELAELFPADEAWDGLTAAALRRAARGVDLPGRSKMRRERLVAALQAEGLQPDVEAG